MLLSLTLHVDVCEEPWLDLASEKCRLVFKARYHDLVWHIMVSDVVGVWPGG